VLAARRKLARDAGVRSMVLMKNERDALPWAADIRRVCVIGPLGDAPAQMRGPWAAAGYEAPHVGVLSALREGLPSADIRFATGVDIAGEERSGIAAAVDLCSGADAILLCLGESADMSGEAASRATPELPGQQRALAHAVLDKARALGVPVTLLLFSGRPLIVADLAERADAVLAAWFLGTEAGNAITDVLTGRVSPSARTPITWPRVLGQVPLFYGERPSGRPANPSDHYTSKYIDAPNEPLYAFGHGLTYGRFTLANLRATPERPTESETIEVSVEVRNEGRHTAEETVLLFTTRQARERHAPVARAQGIRANRPAARRARYGHDPPAGGRAAFPRRRPGARIRARRSRDPRRSLR
jgi:beta-glucosidase